MKKHDKWYALSGAIAFVFIALLVVALFVPSTWIVMAAIATLVAGVLTDSKAKSIEREGADA